MQFNCNRFPTRANNNCTEQLAAEPDHLFRDIRPDQMKLTILRQVRPSQEIMEERAHPNPWLKYTNAEEPRPAKP